MSYLSIIHDYCGAIFCNQFVDDLTRHGSAIMSIRSSAMMWVRCAGHGAAGAKEALHPMRGKAAQIPNTFSTASTLRHRAQ
jgi:hypothetical protein